MAVASITDSRFASQPLQTEYDPVVDLAHQLALIDDKIELATDAATVHRLMAAHGSTATCFLEEPVESMAGVRLKLSFLANEYGIDERTRMSVCADIVTFLEEERAS
jgi:hypothetical protein